MMPEQRAALSDAIGHARAGRMTRRGFLARAAALGLGAGTALGLLEACSARDTIFIVWQSEHDGTETYSQIVSDYNQTNRDHIHVTYLQGPPNPGELYSKYTYMLGARSGSTDVLSLDVTWVVPFAAKRWLYALDRYLTPAARAPFLSAPYRASDFGGHQWAAPYRMDAGMLYYRTDLLPSAPRTWAEMAALASGYQNARVPVDGFVWSGRAGEGLVCLFTEVLHGMGGIILDASNPYQVALDATIGQQAITAMAEWVGHASPAAVTTYSTNEARSIWQAGKAVMMRNWASAHPQRDDPSATAVLGHYHALPTLAADANTTGHPCLAGWQFGVNAYSRNAEAVWRFISYMLLPETQTRMALAGGITPALAAAYTEGAVRARHPFFGEAGAAFAAALPRPISPAYPAITATLQRWLWAALRRHISPSDATAKIQTDLQAIRTEARPLPDSATPTPVLR